MYVLLEKLKKYRHLQEIMYVFEEQIVIMINNFRQSSEAATGGIL